MGRGHRARRGSIGIGVGRRPTLSRPAGADTPTLPWLTRGLPRTATAASQAVGESAQAALSRDAELALSETFAPRRQGDYLSTDLTKHPLFAAAATLVAAGSPENDPQVVFLLRQLNHVRSNHLLRFKARGLGQRRMYELYGLNHVATRYRTAEAEQIKRSLSTSVQRLAGYLSSVSNYDALTANSAAELTEAATEVANNRLIGQLLCNDRHDLARAAAERFNGSHVPRPSPTDLNAFAGVARANHILGVDAPYAKYLAGHGSRPNETARARVRYTTIHAADDDLNDAAYHISHPTPAVAFDADAALAAAHGLLRHPERFGLTTDVRPKALRVNVAVNEAAFMALAERFSDAETWDGIAPFVLSASLNITMTRMSATARTGSRCRGRTMFISGRRSGYAPTSTAPRCRCGSAGRWKKRRCDPARNAPRVSPND